MDIASAIHHAANEIAQAAQHRAIQLNASDARFFFLIAVVLNNLGESNLAEKSMLAAISLTDDAGQLPMKMDGGRHVAGLRQGECSAGNL